MTKAQEIELLENFMATVPENSYLKPWLIENISSIRADIQNDFCICASVTKSLETAKEIVSQAQTKAGEILNEAETKADAIRVEAQADAKRTREYAANFQSRVAGFLEGAARRLYEV